MLQYEDRIYGSFAIENELIQALLNTAAMQRLDDVLQHGVTALIGLTNPISRLEHSIGAMLLVRKLGAPLEEQIAALLHDVSHTAFSHVIDYVFADGTSQSYHDEVKESYLQTTEIPALLEKYGFAWRTFLDEAAFPLLEQDAPALCADRLDYFLRDALDLGIATMPEINNALNNLIVCEGRIATRNTQSARWLAEAYMAADEASWSNYREIGLYYLAAEAIKRGLKIGVIAKEQIWQTDRIVWKQLCASTDPQLRRLTRSVDPETRFIPDEKEADFFAKAKIRTLDPDIKQNGRLTPLSALDPDYAAKRQQYHQRKEGKQPFKIIPPQTLA